MKRWVGVSIGCRTAATALDGEGKVPQEEMRQIAKELGRVLPIALSDTQLENASSLKVVRAGLQELVRESHRVKAARPLAMPAPLQYETDAWVSFLFAAHYPADTLPCQRFDRTLAGASA